MIETMLLAMESLPEGVRFLGSQGVPNGIMLSILEGVRIL